MAAVAFRLEAVDGTDHFAERGCPINIRRIFTLSTQVGMMSSTVDRTGACAGRQFSLEGWQR